MQATVAIRLTDSRDEQVPAEGGILTAGPCR